MAYNMVSMVTYLEQEVLSKRPGFNKKANYHNKTCYLAKVFHFQITRHRLEIVFSFSSLFLWLPLESSSPGRRPVSNLEI